MVAKAMVITVKYAFKSYVSYLRSLMFHIPLSLTAMVARAMVISVKYAFKADSLLVEGQVDDCLYSPAYRDTKQGVFV